MLTYILFTSAVLVLSWVVGTAALVGLDSARCIERNRSLLKIWLGLFVFGWCFTVAALIGPLSVWTVVLVSSALIGICLIVKRVRVELLNVCHESNKVALVIAAALFMLTSVYFSHPVTLYDTGLYHYQAIHWLSEHGFVRGLALFSQRLGFISSWFVLSATLDHGEFVARTTAVLAGVIVFATLLHAAIMLLRIVRGEATYSDWVFVLYVLGLVIFLSGWTGVRSPSPDLPIMLLTGLIACLILELGLPRRIPNKMLNIYLGPYILALFALSIKLTAAPLVLITGIYFFRAMQWRMRALPVLGLVALVLLLPISFAYLVTSGCFFFPVPYLCFDFPWSVGEQAALELIQAIRNFRHATLSSLAWASVFSAMGCLGVMHFLKGRLPDGTLYLVGLSLVSIVYLYIGAPGVRFGYGYLITMPVLFSAWLFFRGSVWAVPSVLLLIIPGFNPDIREISVPLMTGGVLAILFIAFLIHQWLPARQFAVVVSCTLGAVFVLHGSLPDVGSRLRLLPKLTVLRSDQLVVVENERLRYFSPKMRGGVAPGRCFATPLPCSTGPSFDDVSLLDSKQGIAAGFVRDRGEQVRPESK